MCIRDRRSFLVITKMIYHDSFLFLIFSSQSHFSDVFRCHFSQACLQYLYSCIRISTVFRLVYEIFWVVCGFQCSVGFLAVRGSVVEYHGTWYVSVLFISGPFQFSFWYLFIGRIYHIVSDTHFSVLFLHLITDTQMSD